MNFIILENINGNLFLLRNNALTIMVFQVSHGKVFELLVKIYKFWFCFSFLNVILPKIWFNMNREMIFYS